jgi:Flp pilus assembly protein TadG
MGTHNIVDSINRKQPPESVTPPASAPRRRAVAWLTHLRSQDGSQMLEFAFAMPFLVVLAIGVLDFGQAYNLKHILTNAAREAARMVVTNPITDVSCSGGTPCSIEDAASATREYLRNDNLSAASCMNPKNPSSSGTLTWTWACANGVGLTINRGFSFTSTAGAVVQSTQVTLSYPYTWTFSQVIGLLGQGTVSTLPSILSTTLVMENLN